MNFIRRVLIGAGAVVSAILTVLAIFSILGSDWDQLASLVFILIPALLWVAFFFAGGRQNLRLILLLLIQAGAVAAIILVNWQGVFTGVSNLLDGLFNPTAFEAGNTIVACRDAYGCQILHPIFYSAIVLLIVITGFAYTTLLERKVIARFQHRSGPNRVGPFGLLQPAADGVKLAFKEDIIPAGADRPVYYIAPVLKVVPTLILLAVIPLGPDIVVPWFDGVWYRVPLALTDINVGVLWILAVTSVGTYGVVLAGWASNNKYAMLGGLRASAQMISYELSLGLCMAIPVMIVGSMNMRDIVDAQRTVVEWLFLQNPLAAIILAIAFIAEVNRAPFDLPEAEQELTAGFMTEYSGMKFATFMMGEYLGMIGVSAVVVTLFFGGYHFILVDQIPLLGPLVLIGKIVLCLVGFIWLRATLPRIRYDRLMMFGWKVMLPLAIVAVAWTAVSLVIGDTLGANAIVYGLVAGVLLTGALVFGYFVLVRGQQDVAEPDLSDDPIVTGERRSLAWVAINLIGGLVAIPFALYNLTMALLNIGKRLGERPEGAPESKEIVPADKAAVGD